MECSPTSKPRRRVIHPSKLSPFVGAILLWPTERSVRYRLPCVERCCGRASQIRDKASSVIPLRVAGWKPEKQTPCTVGVLISHCRSVFRNAYILTRTERTPLWDSQLQTASSRKTPKSAETPCFLGFSARRPPGRQTPFTPSFRGKKESVTPGVGSCARTLCPSTGGLSAGKVAWRWKRED